MAKNRETYRCSSCGARTLQWLGQCPGCHEWNTLVAVSTLRDVSAASLANPSANVPISLADVPDSGGIPFGCGMDALDHILGGGLMPGSSILVAGEPGIGKSTLLLQMAQGVASRGGLALYATGEEGLGQIKARAARLGAVPQNLQAMAATSVEEVLLALERTSPALLVADSVQTMASQSAEGLPGNVSQARAVAGILAEACRRLGTTLVLVGHVTKDGAIAGPRLLEHMVDTVISLEGDRRQMFRLLRVLKNRFGSNEDLIVFRMRREGLEVVEDPSTFFLGARDPFLSGTAVVMAVDGQRPFAVEAQALVSRSYLPVPRRAALGFDVNRLHMLLAVLEKRLKLNFGQVDIYAKVGGGIRLQDPGLDLALAAAILSSYHDVPLPEKSVFWGEVDLNGQIRPVAAQERRAAQAARLGFNPVIRPPGENGGGGISTIGDLQATLFRKRRE